jgi:hypothetical protein
MKRIITASLLCAFLSLSSTSLLANDLEGRIESVNQEEQSFVVQGIIFYTTPSTDYDDGLRGFSDLKVGQKVEVDFEYRDGKHYAKEIELED